MSPPSATSLNKIRILVTGASGFVGSYFLKAIKDNYVTYAVDRHKPQTSSVLKKGNIIWLLGDLGERDTVQRIAERIAKDGGVDYVFHFAAFYDFTNRDNPEYIRTNINGTRFLLENCIKMGVKRFVFASSLTVTQFSKNDTKISENSPLDATNPYALSKRAAENILREYSNHFPCTIVRMAAIYSDWGEHGPLYILLKKWLGDGWQSLFIAGRGETALPYLHVKDLNNLWLKIIENHSKLTSLDIILASPDGCSSHNDIYQSATSCYSGQAKKAYYIPVWFAALGIMLLQSRSFIGKSRQQFERLWMLKYIDCRMDVDASASRRLIEWKPAERYFLKQRIHLLIENMKGNPELWEQRNLPMTYKIV